MKSKQKEVEMKFRLNSEHKESFVTKLESLGGKFIKNKREIDTYFNVSGRDSLTTKECLRVRETDSHTEITYKPPTDSSAIDLSHFAKQETNLSVPDAKEAINLLELLGNQILVTVDKERSYYEFEDLAVVIDVIKDAGTFVEIEIETDAEEIGIGKIRSLAQELNLDDSVVVNQPYRDIVLNARN
jgi:adenylate cyclase class 2